MQNATSILSPTATSSARPAKFQAFDSQVPSILAQLDPQVFFLQCTLARPQSRHPNRRQNRRWIAESKRRERQNLRDGRPVVELFQIHHRINCQSRMKIRCSKPLAGISFQTLPKLGHHFRRHAYARRLPVARRSERKLRHRFQRLQQMKRRDAAAGTLRLAIFFAQHKHGPIKPVHQTARDNPHHAAMPIGSGEYQRGLIFGNRNLRAFFQHQSHDVCLGLLPLLIQRMQLLRQSACLFQIFGKEHADDIVRIVHAPGRIDARGDLKRHLARVRGPASSNPETSSNARRPGLWTRCKPCKPYFTMIRFSPMSGTTSATVATATNFKNDFNMRASFSSGQPSVASNACTSLNATPAPQRFLSG